MLFIQNNSKKVLKVNETAKWSIESIVLFLFLNVNLSNYKT